MNKYIRKMRSLGRETRNTKRNIKSTSSMENMQSKGIILMEAVGTRTMEDHLFQRSEGYQIILVYLVPLLYKALMKVHYAIE